MERKHSSLRWHIRLLASLFVVVLLSSAQNARAQSAVLEITWNVYTTYKGLMVTYPDNSGLFVVNFWSPDIAQNVTVLQDVRVSYQYDIYGNCTTFLNCFNPETYPYVPYSADNFVIYPNGTMYTQDYSGNWTTAIIATMIDPRMWSAKFREYGLD